MHERWRLGNPFPTEAEQLEQLLKDRRFDTWGFVIYRCAYGNDKAWEECMQILKARERRQLEWYEKPELYDSLAWTVLEDLEAFDQATKQDLRGHFKDWIAPKAKNEQPRAQRLVTKHRPWKHIAPRYGFFIAIDQASMESVLENPYPEAILTEQTGYVNLVDAYWKFGADCFRDQLESVESKGDLEEFFHTDPDLRFDEMPDFTFEPIEGCREEVGWTRLPASEMGMQAYQMLGHSPHMWQNLYRRPPELGWRYY